MIIVLSQISGMSLPEWGFHQLEVCTDKSIKQTNTIWNVEEHQQNITYRKSVSVKTRPFDDLLIDGLINSLIG